MLLSITPKLETVLLKIVLSNKIMLGDDAVQVRTFDPVPYKIYTARITINGSY